MAVTASSAFPGFFPPLELQAEDVGADPGQFGRLAFTDGGVYDNLGVRMFRCLERSWMAQEIRLQEDELVDAEQLSLALQAAVQATESTPLRRLAQMMAMPHNGVALHGTAGVESVDRLLDGLWHVLSNENLARELEFAHLSPADPDAIPVMHAAQDQGNDIEPGEKMWLNRQLVDAAFKQATGNSCFRSLNACFDAVLVSDAGKQFKIANDGRASGLIGTAMRSTDIVMDRVWQLETETFNGTPGYVFAPINMVVEPVEDPTALHPEVQRMATGIRTDLDRFSPLEISSLIQHGYCVGRSACRSRPDLFGTTIPTTAPWNPLASPKSEPTAAEPSSPIVTAPIPKTSYPMSASEPVVETKQTRELQKSAGRRIWSTLLDYRDWISFIYVPLLIPILFILPWYSFKLYQQAQVAQRLIESMAQSNRDFSAMSKLLQDGPIDSFNGLPVQKEGELIPLDYSGFEVIADTRIMDLRPWKIDSGGPDENSWVYLHRRLRVKKIAATADEFVVRIRVSAAKAQLRSLDSPIAMSLRAGQDNATNDGKPVPFVDAVFDLSRVPANEVVDLSYELMARDQPKELLQSSTIYVDAETALLTCWWLLPAGKQHQSMDILRYPTGKASRPERVVPANEIIFPDGQIVSFTLLSVEPGYKYERRWTYRD